MRILIVKTSSLGDIIHAFPVLSYLRQKFPTSSIDWVVEAPYAELVKTHPDVNQVYSIHSKEWRKAFFSSKAWSEIFNFRHQLRKHCYDVVFDLQSNIKSGIVTFCVKSPIKVGFGKKTVHEYPNLLFTNCRFDPPKGQNVRDENLFLVQSYFQDRENYQDPIVYLKMTSEQRRQLDSLLHFPSPSVMVCPGSAWPNKQMSFESLKTFLIHTQQFLKCFFLWVWGTPQEKEIAQSFHSTFPNHSTIMKDRLSLPLLQNLMHHVNYVIAMDSLPLHLAGTTKTPTFSIFGASSANKYKPKGCRHEVIQGLCPYGMTFERRCPILRTCSTGACIKNLSGIEVFQAFKKWHEKYGE